MTDKFLSAFNQELMHMLPDLGGQLVVVFISGIKREVFGVYSEPINSNFNGLETTSTEYGHSISFRRSDLSVLPSRNDVVIVEKKRFIVRSQADSDELTVNYWLEQSPKRAGAFSKAFSKAFSGGLSG